MVGQNVKHLDDDELVLHAYEEAEADPVAGGHLAACQECQERLEALRRDLAAFDTVAVPERGDDYGARVWARLEPRLQARPGWRDWMSAWFSWPHLAMAGGVAVLVVAAFVAGRLTRTTPAIVTPPAEASAAVVKERILLVAVGDHLERSRMVLAEIVNNSGNVAGELGVEQATAGDLVATNRLYRQTALDTGDSAMASALEDLERVLVEIANGRAAETAEGLEQLRERIESQGLIFKVTVLGAQVRQRQQDAAGTGPTRTDSST